MAITKCSNCGCEDSFLTSPAPCPTPAGCPDPEPCYQVIDANCVTYSGSDIICDTNIVVAQNTSVAEGLQNLNTFYCENLQATPRALHMTLAYSPIVSVFPWKNNTTADTWYRNSALFIPSELLPTGKAIIRLLVTTEHNAGSDLKFNLYEVNSATYFLSTWLTVTGTALDEFVSSDIFVDFNLLPGGASVSRWIELQAYIENSAQFYHIDKIDIEIIPVL